MLLRRHGHRAVLKPLPPGPSLQRTCGGTASTWATCSRSPTPACLPRSWRPPRRWRAWVRRAAAVVVCLLSWGGVTAWVACMLEWWAGQTLHCGLRRQPPSTARHFRALLCPINSWPTPALPPVH